MYSPLRNSRVKLSVGQIFWHEVGQGPKLVFLHGSWQDSSQWLRTIEHLSPYYQCFAPDLLGFGDSERPKIHYSIDLEVECLAQYLDTLKLREVYLIAHSLGGWVATSYAIKYPDRVQGLVLLAPEGVKVGNRRGRWQTASWLMGQPPLAFWWLRSIYPIAKLLGSQNKIDGLLNFRQELMQSPVAVQLLFRRRQAEITAELVDENLPLLKAPVLLLHGSEDTTAASSLCQSYAALAPNAELQLVSPGGSNLPQEVPDVVAKYIREFAK
ncbi:alpha/beta fold hydrolase [Microcoleus vaginatus]|uniref:alpha/beta fold hydrolase n=1 Tax=Microcoleus vaginatus TaxID=119532 RepID=UPI001F613FCC|nr:alpha/beta hydrolase [Microcoleus vaginatus HSN003]